MADIVHDFLQRLAQLAPEVSTHTRARLEADIRKDWGGTEPYVAKRPRPAVQAERLGMKLQSRSSLKQCFEEVGVSRRTGYRLLARK